MKRRETRGVAAWMGEFILGAARGLEGSGGF